MIRALIIACVLFLMAAGLPAAKPPAGVTIDPEIRAWFEGQTNPVTGQYCCDVSDGHRLAMSDWREGPEGPEVMVSGLWFPVPPEAVLEHHPNPTGDAVAWWVTDKGIPHFYCFVRPAMS